MDRLNLEKVAATLAKEHCKSQLTAGFVLTGTHPYYNEQRKLIYFKIRLKHPDGRKWIRPFHYSTQEQKYVMGEPDFINKKPLYNLLNLQSNQNDPVLTVEGELCSDISTKHGLLSTTSGSATSARKADWTTLANRTVHIWPDKDDEGYKYAEEVNQILKELNCTIKIVDIKKLNIPEKGDIVDWLEANPNATREDIFTLPVIEDIINDENTSMKFINELAKLSELNYQKQRKDAAKRLNISITLLDKLVKQSRSEINNSSNEIFSAIEPWNETVDVKTLLDELVQLVNRFIAFPSTHEAKAIALYILHTHCIDAADCSPILNICSPEKRCGKSTLLSVMQRLVNRPLVAASISPAAIFRSIEMWKPITLIIDEGDTFLPENEEARGIINSGHTRDSSFVIRCVGDNHAPARFNTWCPKIIAAIGHLQDTIEDRSIIIQLCRKLNTEKKDKIRDVQKLIFNNLLRKCIRFTIDNIEHLKKIIPSIPPELNDRAADNWAPLITIAELAGKDWVEAAKKAALHLCCSKQEPMSIGVELLQDIEAIFNSKMLINGIYTSELINMLCEDSEAPWATYNRGKPLTPRQLSNRLKEYKIHSKDIRLPPMNKNLKGYIINDFKEAFNRYIPSAPPKEGASNATNR